MTANPFAAALARDLSPTALADLLGLRAYAWQRELFAAGNDDVLVLKGRQVGWSTAIAVLSLQHLLLDPLPGEEPRTVILASPSMRQSARLIDVLGYWLGRLGQKVELDTSNVSTVQLANGNRAVGLPGTEGQSRGYRATLLCADELGHLDDGYWSSVLRPMTLLGGRTVAGGTPNGKRGVLHDLWHAEAATRWRRIMVRTGDVLPREKVEELRAELGPVLAAQELDAEFTELARGPRLFTPEVLDQMFANEFEAWG